MRDASIKKGKGGLRRAFLTMNILPLIILGIFIVTLGFNMYTAGLENEVRNGLKSVGETVISSYDYAYEGEFNLLVNDETGEMFLRKGNTILSGDTALIDDVKEKTGIDITIFFYDIRMITTIVDKNNETVEGSAVHRTVSDAVLSGKKEMFYKSVQIGEVSYFAEYIPIFGKDGTVLGMIGAAKPSEDVAKLVNQSMFSNILLMIAALLIVVFIINRFSKNLVNVIQKMMRFMGNIAEGNLNAELEETVLNRNDELGEMGRFTTHVQASLRKLIERDALTNIYNRRSGQNRMEQIRGKYVPFSVVMADIDFFKKVNDTYGHDAGDEVLKTVARILTDSMVGKGFACRWGGEEFLLVFENLVGDEVVACLESTLEIIRNTEVVCGENNIHVTMSFGITEGDNEASIDEQLKRADNGLYYAKMHGRNQVVFADRLTEADFA